MDKNVSLENRTHNNSHSRHKTYGFFIKTIIFVEEHDVTPEVLHVLIWGLRKHFFSLHAFF